MNAVRRNALALAKASLMEKRYLFVVAVLMVLLIMCKNLPDDLQFILMVPSTCLIVAAVLIIRNNGNANSRQFRSFLVSSGFSRKDVYKSEVLTIFCFAPFLILMVIYVGYTLSDAVNVLHMVALLTSAIVMLVMLIEVISYTFDNKSLAIVASGFVVLLMIPFGYMGYTIFNGGDSSHMFAQISIIYAAISVIILYFCGMMVVSKHDF